MHPDTAWLRLTTSLGEEGRPPLRALHGMRHHVHKGDCCAVHSHFGLEIVYHPRGSGVTRLGAQAEVRFQPGGIVLYAPGQPHDQVMDKRGDDFCLQIEIPGPLRAGLRGALHIPPPIDPLVKAELEALTEDRVWLQPSGKAILHLRATGVLLSLLQASSVQVYREAMPRTERYVAEAESYLRDRFQTIDSLQEVARHVGISHDRLRHLFQEQRKTTLVRFLNELRLERARSLLIHSRLPIKQVAALSGFRDEYYFSAVFRRFHRLPPGGYREEAGKRR